MSSNETKKKHIQACLAVMGGSHKPLIMFMIQKGINRFSLLHKEMGVISKQLLTKQLRELEADRVIKRKSFPEIPPRVEYSLTPFGWSLLPIVDAMEDWGVKHR